MQLNDAFVGAIGAVVAAVIVAAFGLIPFLIARRKTESEAENFISEAAATLVVPLRKELENTRKELQETKTELKSACYEIGVLKQQFRDQEKINLLKFEQQEKENARLRRWIELLVAQLVAHNITPIEEPSE